VIADAFRKKPKKTGSSFKPLPVVNAIAIHGCIRRSGCTPAEPYPPVHAGKLTKNFELCHPQYVRTLN
jgi:hypothetical protein